MGTGLDLLQSSVCCTGVGNNRIYCRGGSRISGKGVGMYKGMGVGFADFISFFLNMRDQIISFS